MVLAFVTQQMDLEVSVLSEVSQTQQPMFKCLQTGFTIWCGSKRYLKQKTEGRLSWLLHEPLLAQRCTFWDEGSCGDPGRVPHWSVYTHFPEQNSMLTDSCHALVVLEGRRRRVGAAQDGRERGTTDKDICQMPRGKSL